MIDNTVSNLSIDLKDFCFTLEFNRSDQKMQISFLKSNSNIVSLTALKTILIFSVSLAQVK